MTVRLRRKVVREYGIKSLVEAPVTFLENKLCRRDYLYQRCKC
jgi:hypothetical protein